MTVLGKTRIQLDLADDLVKTLAKLERMSGATTRAEVIRRAINVYNVLWDAWKNEGARIEIVHPGNKKRERLLLH